MRYLAVKRARAMGIGQCPNFSVTGSVRGMRRKYYGKAALLVRSGSYIYNVTGKPEIYEAAR